MATSAPPSAAQRPSSWAIIDSEPDVVAGLRELLVLACALHASERVDVDASGARAAAKVRVVSGLDAGLPNPVARRVALVDSVLELLLRDLADVAEDLGGNPALVVAPQRHLADLDAREVVLVLEEVIDLRVGNVRLDRDRCEKVVLPCLEVALHLPVPEAEELRHAAERLLPLLGAQPVERSRPKLRDGARDVRHEHLPVPVEDRAARRRSPEGPDLVVARFVEVLLAGDDLERPEPEEQDAEDGDREDSEDRNPQGQLRREAVGLLDPGIGREEAARETRGIARQRG
jgi:hypothetical protein